MLFANYFKLLVSLFNFLNSEKAKFTSCHTESTSLKIANIYKVEHFQMWLESEFDWLGVLMKGSATAGSKSDFYHFFMLKFIWHYYFTVWSSCERLPFRVPMSDLPIASSVGRIAGVERNSLFFTAVVISPCSRKHLQSTMTQTGNS